jgi:subtilisin family serine protease
VLIAAGGNDGDSTVNYPAGYAQVVSVAATDDSDARASFSNATPTWRSRRRVALTAARTGIRREVLV